MTKEIPLSQGKVAWAYDAAALKLFGDFARLNLPEQILTSPIGAPLQRGPATEGLLQTTASPTANTPTGRASSRHGIGHETA